MVVYTAEYTNMDESTPRFRQDTLSRYRGREHHPGSVLYHSLRIFESVSLFFCLATLIVSVVFVMGNYQEFQDETQFLLLEILRVAGVLCALSSLYYGGALLAWIVTRRHFLPGRLLYALTAVAVGAAGIAATSFVSVMASPV